MDGTTFKLNSVMIMFQKVTSDTQETNTNLVLSIFLEGGDHSIGKLCFVFTNVEYNCFKSSIFQPEPSVKTKFPDGR